MSFPRYPRYKDSGVEWLGEVPEHWRVIPGRRLFEQRREPSDPADEQLSATQKYGVVPQRLFMELEDQKVVLALTGTEAFKRVQENDFVISLRSFQGGIEHSAYSGCVSPAYTVLRPCSAVCPRFWAYVMKSTEFIAALQSVTDGIRDGKSISYQQFGAVKVPVFPLAEQRAIASLLDCETAKIDTFATEQRYLIELLAEKRRAVISHAVTKGLNPNAPMMPSGIEWLGDVPAHWAIKRLKAIIDEPLQYGANEAADSDDPSQPRFIRITDINKSGALREETFRSLPAEVAAPYLLKDGDVLFARSGATVGKTFLYSESWGEACFAGYLIRARLATKHRLSQWVGYFCQSASYWDYVLGSQIQATIQNVSAEKYATMSLPIPPDTERTAIIDYLDEVTRAFDEMISEAERAIALLQERRAALISAAVTGKIDVRGLAEAA